ncbi:bidirectional sugar transporter SWEET9-like [Cornus florida]|uniref:bidirectional sugar transporter SWEET9-like n=1 Tax=Cornus florida TaxID=4283 RepID=UPI0028A0D535|nr:bidirectional sugar transporter SWEET9-like [Cornus florida]
MSFLSSHGAFAFGLLGNIVGFLVFLAPVPTFYKIYKKKSTEGFQSLPYVIGLFSAMLLIYYAFLKSSSTILLITINSFGCLIETTYILLYIFYAPKKTRIQTIKLFISLNVVGFGLLLLLTQFLAKGLTRLKIVGMICLVFSLCVFVAPLCIVRQVIRTKSVEYMPFLLSFFLTLGAVMWFFYGLLEKDYNIAIPNILGFGFGVLQMVLYVIYKKPKKVDHEEQMLPELQNQIIVLEEHKLPELTEQIINIVTLSAMVCSEEILPLDVEQVKDNGHDDIVGDQNVAKENMEA